MRDGISVQAHTLVHQLSEGAEFATRVLWILLHQLPGHLLHIQIRLSNVLLKVLQCGLKNKISTRCDSLRPNLVFFSFFLTAARARVFFSSLIFCRLHAAFLLPSRLEIDANMPNLHTFLTRFVIRWSCSTGLNFFILCGNRRLFH